MKIKKFVMLNFLILIAISVSYASVGVSISPASGDYEFSLDGGEIELTIFNTGSENNFYVVNITKLSDVVKVDEPIIEVPADSYKTISMVIAPHQDIKENEEYELELEVYSKGFEGIQVSAKIKAVYTIKFIGKRTLPWQETGKNEIIPIELENKKSGSNGLSIEYPIITKIKQNMIYIVILVALVGIASGTIFILRRGGYGK